ncbi:hypothetical protein HanHA300_Chr10g0353591 [Helianthus annuus]|nr:hypothetical protein HanHA300_Chr10g0353591 [Helianthus annuus]KAJ0529187.1 hypothetical protein HanHA89_Chr10g0374901 [Helianthus annuus]KAJ0696069.1 hypothetical protein HanLR1_Chr10g0352741 [Helianthus annuus]
MIYNENELNDVIQRGLLNDINHTSFITRTIYDLVYENKGFGLRFMASRFINYNQICFYLVIHFTNNLQNKFSNID